MWETAWNWTSNRFLKLVLGMIWGGEILPRFFAFRFRGPGRIVVDMDENKNIAVRGKGGREDHDGENDSVTASDLSRQRRILELFGTIDFDPDYDYKAARNRRQR